MLNYWPIVSYKKHIILTAWNLLCKTVLDVVYILLKCGHAVSRKYDGKMLNSWATSMQHKCENGRDGELSIHFEWMEFWLSQLLLQFPLILLFHMQIRSTVKNDEMFVDIIIHLFGSSVVCRCCCCRCRHRCCWCFCYCCRRFKSQRRNQRSVTAMLGIVTGCVCAENCVWCAFDEHGWNSKSCGFTLQVVDTIEHSMKMLNRLQLLLELTGLSLSLSCSSFCHCHPHI